MAEFLRIDGWGDFQKYRGKRAGFILDATDQNEKAKLSGLSMFTRGVLQELRRMRGRTGKNIPYDIAHIARATHTIPTDRPHLHHALDTLISRGVLVLTNQQDDISKTHEIEKENNREIEKEKEQKKAAPVIEKIPENSDVKIQEIAKAHPKFSKPVETEREIVGQLDRLGDRMGVESAMKYLLERTLHYSQAYKRWDRERQKYSPESPRWFRSACFEEDPDTWEAGADPPPKTPEEIAREKADLMADVEHHRRRQAEKKSASLHS